MERTTGRERRGLGKSTRRSLAQFGGCPESWNCGQPNGAIAGDWAAPRGGGRIPGGLSKTDRRGPSLFIPAKLAGGYRAGAEEQVPVMFENSGGRWP